MWVKSGLSAMGLAALDTSPDGVWVIDVDGSTIYASPEIARIHRIPTERLPGLTAADTLDEADRSSFARHLALVAQGAPTAVTETEVAWIRSDGSSTQLRLTETVLTDEAGAAYAVLRRYADDTERQSLQASLHASEAARADQVDQNDLMQSLISAANQAGTLSEVLVRAHDLMLRRQDWQEAFAFLAVDDTLVLFTPDGALPQLLASDATERELASRCHHLGRLQWDASGLIVAFPVYVAGKVHAVIAVTAARPVLNTATVETHALQFADQLGRVALRQAADAELARARDHAMEVAEQRSEFVATVSHELRTPLNGVIGLTELLLRSPLDPEQQRLASGVQAAGRTLLDVVNDILDFSKLEAGRMELELVPFQIRSLLDQVASLLEETARTKGLDLTVSCDPEVPVLLIGDPTRLTQVLTNLVSNAVKFTPTGRVAVSVTSAADPEGAARAPGTTGRVALRIEVRDTGIGIAPEQLVGLFDAWSQADVSTTRRFGGTGLGLTICREIVTAMGGAVSHADNPTGGSVFRVDVAMDVPVEGSTLPGGSDHDEVDQSNGDDVARRVLSGRRVLLVDEGDGDVLADQLSYWGMHLERVPSVRTSLQRLRPDAAPEVDLVIAAFDGAERFTVQLTDRLSTAARQHSLPLLTLASPADVARLRAGGATDLLARPVLPALLRSTLVRMLVGDSPQAISERLADPDVCGRILVVEDHPINQMVAEGLLTALGYTCEVVEDGVAGAEAAAAGGFDAILMDVQMPRLDGCDATRRIRAEAAGGPRVPIIAMTATAMSAERDRCLDAGMDDFLCKPIDATLLAVSLQRWLGAAESTPDPEVAASTRPDPQAPVVLDLARLEELRRLDGPDASYVGRAVGNFLAASVRDLAEMRLALDAGEWPLLGTVAHRLAGVALNLGAAAAGASLQSLDHAVRSGASDSLELARLLADARDQLGPAHEALSAYLNEHTAVLS